MAPRSSTGFAKKPPAAVEPVRVTPPARALPEEQEIPDPIPIDLAPLIAPYRRQGRISLRVERLPHRARLSHGQINGDRSFSLTLDELEELQYLPPPGGGDPPTLGIRIIRVGAGDASTLAVLDYIVSPETTGAGALALNDTKEQRRLRDEIVKLKALLQARDSELADALAAVDKIKGVAPLPAPPDVDVAALRAAWDAEAEERVAEAVRLERQRNRAESDDAERLAASESKFRDRMAQERDRLQKEADAALKKAEKDWKAAEAARAAVAEAVWQKRVDKTLADAQAQSRAANDAELRKLRDDLANAKTSLEEREADLARERATKSQTRDGALTQQAVDLDRLRGELAKAKAELIEHKRQLAQERDAARLSRSEIERQRSAELNSLRDDLAKLKTALSERERESAGEKAAAKEIRAQSETLRGTEGEAQRLRDELAKLKAELAERDKGAAKTSWERQAERGSAETKISRLGEELTKARAALAARESELKRVRTGEHQMRAEAETLRADSAEMKRVTAELVQVKALLAVREAELAGARSANDEERERWRRDADASLTEARRILKEGEAERLAGAEAEWRKQSDVAISEVVARLHEAEARLREGSNQGEKTGAELARLRNDRTRLKSELAQRDNELLQAKLSQEQARERWKREMDEALDKAQRAWRADETARIAASEAIARDHNTIVLNETKARLKHTESLLAEAKSHVETLRRRGDPEDVARLRNDFASVQAELARREKEIMELRADREIERVRLANEARTQVQRADLEWHEDDADEAERARRAQSIRSMIRTVAIAVAFAGLAAVGYYKIAPMITNTGVLDPIMAHDNMPSAATAPAPAVPKAVLTVLRSAKLRAGPSTADAVLGSLAANAQVHAFERQGKWVRIDVVAKAGGKPQAGWVVGSVLGAPVTDVKTPSSASKK